MIESNIDPNPVPFPGYERRTIYFTEPQWERAKRSAQRRGIEDVDAYIVEVASEEPMSMKMVRAEWIKTHLQVIAEALPQIGPLREKIEALILSLG